MSTTRPSHLVSPRPQTKGAATKQALMGAARRVFAASGYINATVPDIAAEAGKSPATFYKYFANKQDMLEALLSEFVERIDERLRVPQDASRSELDQVRTAVGTFWSVYREFRAEWIAITQAASVDPGMVNLWMRIRDRGIRRILQLVRLVRGDDAVGGVDPVVMASNMSAMIEHTAYLWLGLEANSLGRPVDDDAAIDALTRQWYSILKSGAD